MSSFGAKIKAAREALGISQTEFAALVGINTQRAISAWETDRSIPDAMMIAKVCRLLDISSDYLLGLTDEPKPGDVMEARLCYDEFLMLDETGKKAVKSVIKTQIERCNEKKMDDLNFHCSHKDNKTGISELFIKKNAKDYDKAKERIDELKQEKKNANVSYEFIVQALWHRGYNGLISISDLVQVFSGRKVPSIQLVNDILDVLMLEHNIIKEHYKNSFKPSGVLA